MLLYGLLMSVVLWCCDSGLCSGLVGSRKLLLLSWWLNMMSLMVCVRW